MSGTMSPAELEAAIRAVGAERYHDKHPFHRLLHGGKLDKGQVQAWALNRYCYQSGVPRKDAALMSRTHDRELRREWIHRMLDHDGSGGEEGGIERWLVLTDALGLDRDYVVSMQGALPATRFAVEAYVTFVRERTLLEAVASSLTELFAPSIHRERIAGMLESYDFVDRAGHAVFQAPSRPGQPRRRLRPRLRQAARDDAPRAGRRRRRRALQVQRAVGPARRPASRLRHARPDPARRLPAGGEVTTPADAMATAMQIYGRRITPLLPPPASKASPSTRRGGRTVRPRLGPAIADIAAHSTAGPSRWTHLVGVTGGTRDRHPHLGTPSDLARPSAIASSVAMGELSPWRSVLPPRRDEGDAFVTGGGEACGSVGAQRRPDSISLCFLESA